MTRLEDLVVDGLVQEHVSIGALTTYKFGGPARWFSEPRTRDELDRVLDALDGVDILVLGRGSNLVVSDSGFDGIAIRLAGQFAEVAIDAAVPQVTAGAAVNLPRLARTVAQADHGGLEFMVGVPGSVGGAVAMNAGCFGSETADWMVSASILDLPTRTISKATPAVLDMSYRHTNLTADQVVLDATFRLEPADRAVAEAKMREITRWRKENQPGGTLNAGSVFKNPTGDAAGRIIDSLGLRGHRRGNVQVSDRHANFFVANPDATAQELYDLVMDVRHRVEQATGIRLEPEIRFAGSFAPDTSPCPEVSS